MATSKEIYNRIVWDRRLDTSSFIIGYQERMSLDDLREKPLTQWQTDGDIPWHRIRYIRCQDTIVWDRDRHLDLISTDNLPSSAWLPLNTSELTTNIPKINFKSRLVYRYRHQDWHPQDLLKDNLTKGSLKIITLNVLCDLYKPEEIDTEKRFAAIVEHLSSSNADIIVLEEATPYLLTLLLQQNWVKNYYLSESPLGKTLKPYGILILSRYSFSLVEHRYSAYKRALVGSWLLDGEWFHLAGVHLTSNHAKNARETRAHQLTILLDYLSTLSGNCTIVGDFNSVEPEQDLLLQEGNFIDLWQNLHPEDPGYTFDPTKNTLATLMSRTGEPARLDRIWLRGNLWQGLEIAIFGDRPLQHTPKILYPSDHFGLEAILESSQRQILQTLPPAYQTAIVIIPEEQVLPPIQNIRRRFDRSFQRWMPHINLIYGFIGDRHFPQAAKLIQSVIKELEPFTIRLEKFQTFKHSASCTLWLKPIVDPPNALQDLQTKLQQLFPQCNEQSQKSAAGFTPHLTVGQFRTLAEAETNLPDWHPVTFTVDSICLISRHGEEKFVVRDRLYFANSLETQGLHYLVNKLEPDLDRQQKEAREIVLSLVEQACTEYLGNPASIHLLGSALLGVQTPDSDLDLVCLIPATMSGRDFLAGVAAKLGDLCDRFWLVEEAKVPALRMQIDGISVDLLYARSPLVLGSAIDLSQVLPSHFDPVSWQAIVGYLEAQVILTKTSREDFSLLLRTVRAWAKCRQINNNGLGFLGNFSWALLTVWTYSSIVENSSLASLLANFFQKLSQHDWKVPIALTEDGNNYQVQLPRDRLPIVTSIPPCQNSARNITRSTAKIIQEEFIRGDRLIQEILAGKRSWQDLFNNADLLEKTDFLVAIATKPETGELDRGWWEGKAVGLILELERQFNLQIRPIIDLSSLKEDSNKRTDEDICLALGVQLPLDSKLETQVLENAIQEYFARQTSLTSYFSLRFFPS
jgi:poly(A) polymerase